MVFLTECREPLEFSGKAGTLRFEYWLLAKFQFSLAPLRFDGMQLSDEFATASFELTFSPANHVAELLASDGNARDLVEFSSNSLEFTRALADVRLVPEKLLVPFEILCEATFFFAQALELVDKFALLPLALSIPCHLELKPLQALLPSGEMLAVVRQPLLADTDNFIQFPHLSLENRDHGCPSTEEFEFLLATDPLLAESFPFVSGEFAIALVAVKFQEFGENPFPLGGRFASKLVCLALQKEDRVDERGVADPKQAVDLSLYGLFPTGRQWVPAVITTNMQFEERPCPASCGVAADDTVLRSVQNEAELHTSLEFTKTDKVCVASSGLLPKSPGDGIQECRFASPVLTTEAGETKPREVNLDGVAVTQELPKLQACRDHGGPFVRPTPL